MNTETNHKAVEWIWSMWPMGDGYDFQIAPLEWQWMLELYNWTWEWPTAWIPFFWNVATISIHIGLSTVLWWCRYWMWWNPIGWLLWFADWCFFWLGRLIGLPAAFLGPWNLIGGTEIWAVYQIVLVAIYVLVVIVLFFPGLLGMEPLFAM